MQRRTALHTAILAAALMLTLVSAASAGLAEERQKLANLDAEMIQLAADLGAAEHELALVRSKANDLGRLAMRIKDDPDLTRRAEVAKADAKTKFDEVGKLRREIAKKRMVRRDIENNIFLYQRTQ